MCECSNEASQRCWVLDRLLGFLYMANGQADISRYEYLIRVGNSFRTRMQDVSNSSHAFDHRSIH